MSPGLPCRDLRVVTIEHAVAAPLCSRHLSELGAEVIKVERPRSGDFARTYDGVAEGDSSHFVWLNHGKKSVAIDLKTEAGRKALEGLVSKADVLMWNLGPGSMEKILPIHKLRQTYRSLITCELSGYGTTGPYKDRKAFDLLIQGEAGVTANTGRPGAYAKPGVSLADLAGGVYAFASILAALVERSKTGAGRHISVSLFDAVCEWMMPLLLLEEHTEGAPPPAGTAHASIVPYGAFATHEGVLVNIAVQNLKQWRSLAGALLGETEYERDCRYESNEYRLASREELESVLAARFRELPLAQVIELLDESDIPWGLVRSTDEVLNHPQLSDRQRWIEIENSKGRRVRVLLSPFLTQQLVMRSVPELGQDQDVLDALYDE